MITITLPSGAFHIVSTFASGTPDLLAYTTSENTRAALQAAYDAGQWEEFTPPEPEPEIAEPDWPAFRLALLQSATFRTWSETLPDTWREDLKLAAIAANAEALQSIYDHLATYYPPAPAAAAEWQAIATANSIPVVFSDV